MHFESLFMVGGGVNVTRGWRSPSWWQQNKGSVWEEPTLTWELVGEVKSNLASEEKREVCGIERTTEIGWWGCGASRGSRADTPQRRPKVRFSNTDAICSGRRWIMERTDETAAKDLSQLCFENTWLRNEASGREVHFPPSSNSSSIWRPQIGFVNLCNG